MRSAIFAAVLLVSPMAWADGALNNPKGAYDSIKSAVDTLEPAVEHLYDFGGEWRTGLSASVYDYKDLVALRAGYIMDFAPYLSAPVKFQNILKRWTPDSADSFLDTAGKYLTVGPFAGYNLDRNEDGNQNDGGLIYGLSVGAKISF